jgi:hypothetical protein
MSESDDWRDLDACERCGDSDVPLRAIKMREGRRRLLCIDCFFDAEQNGEVDPDDPRIDDPPGRPNAPGQQGGQP